VNAVYRTWIVVLLVVALLISCTPVIETRYIIQPLTHEPRPVLPKIKASELECLSQDTYQKLADRQRLISSYAITLEAIIESTQPDKANER
jgi:hypothetical protein